MAVKRDSGAYAATAQPEDGYQPFGGPSLAGGGGSRRATKLRRAGGFGIVGLTKAIRNLASLVGAVAVLFGALVQLGQYLPGGNLPLLNALGKVFDPVFKDRYQASAPPGTVAVIRDVTLPAGTTAAGAATDVAIQSVGSDAEVVTNVAASSDLDATASVVALETTRPLYAYYERGTNGTLTEAGRLRLADGSLPSYLDLGVGQLLRSQGQVYLRETDAVSGVLADEMPTGRCLAILAKTRVVEVKDAESGGWLQVAPYACPTAG